MLGQHHSLTTLKSRKRALVEEAEAQREELGCDMEIVRSGLRRMGTQAKSFGSIASTIALVIAGLSTFRAARGLGRNGGASFLSRVLFGARLASTVWLALSARRR
jgi:hypothetical protein